MEKNKKPSPGDDEELHVLVMGTTDSQVNKASKMVKDLLIPVEEDKNEHKRQQLRELAEINGTLVNRTWSGAVDLSYRRTDIMCAICGDKSHPTSDCTLRGSNVSAGGQGKSRVESEYDAFLSEIGEAPPPPPPEHTQQSYNPNQYNQQNPPPPPPTNTMDAYAEFQAAISSMSNPYQQHQQQHQQNPWNQYQQQQQYGQYPYQQQSAYGSVPPPPPGYYNQ